MGRILNQSKRGANMKFNRLLVILAVFCLVVACMALPTLFKTSSEVVASAEVTLPTSGALSSGTYTLTENITLTGALTIASGENVTIDLNGYNITFSSSTSDKIIANKGTLTVKDSSVSQEGTISYTFSKSSSSCYAINNYGGVFNLESGIVNITRSKGTSSVYGIYSGTINMTGGTLNVLATSQVSSIYAISSTGSILGGTVTASTAKTTGTANVCSNSTTVIYGGTFSGKTVSATVMGGTFSFDPSAKVPPYKYSINKDETAQTWTVVENENVENRLEVVGGAQYAIFEDVFSNVIEGSVIKLLNDYDLGAMYVSFPSGLNLTLDLNGQTLSGSSDKVISLAGGLTIIDSASGGCINHNYTGTSAMYTVTLTSTSTQFTLESGDINTIYNGTGGISTNHYSGSVFSDGYGTVTVKGGNVIVTNNYSDAKYSYVYGVRASSTTLTMTGGAVIATGPKHAYGLGFGGNESKMTGGMVTATSTNSSGTGITGVGTVSGGTVIANGNVLSTSTAVIEGGTFEGTSVSAKVLGGTFNFDPISVSANIPAYIYKVVDNSNGTWSVVEVPEDELPKNIDVDGSKFATFELAQSAIVIGSKITLLEDYNGGKAAISLPQGITLDLNGKTLTLDKTVDLSLVGGVDEDNATVITDSIATSHATAGTIKALIKIGAGYTKIEKINIDTTEIGKSSTLNILGTTTSLATVNINGINMRTASVDSSTVSSTSVGDITSKYAQITIDNLDENFGFVIDSNYCSTSTANYHKIFQNNTKATVTIKGGVFNLSESGANHKVYFAYNDASTSLLFIEDGEFNFKHGVTQVTEVALIYARAQNDSAVTGGKFYTDLTTADTFGTTGYRITPTFIKGGIYNVQPRATAFVKGYECIDNADGATNAIYLYAVGFFPQVKVGEKDYVALQDALEAMYTGEETGREIVLLRNITLGTALVIKVDGITFIQGEYSIAWMENAATLTLYNEVQTLNGIDMSVFEACGNTTTYKTYYKFFKDAANNASNVTLLKDVTLESVIYIYAYNLTLNLGDNTITSNAYSSSYPGLFTVAGTNMGAVTLTVNAMENGGIISNSCYCFHVGNSYAGNLIINGGNYISALTCVNMQNGTATINGGTFKILPSQDTTSEHYNNYEFTVNCIDDNRANCTVTINGGSFYKFNPANNESEGVGTDYTSDEVVCSCYNAETEYYTVASEHNFEDLEDTDCNNEGCSYVAVARIGEKRFDLLQSAIDEAAEGQTIVLLSNIQLAKVHTVSATANITIDLNGFAVTVEKETELRSLYAFENKGTFTLEDSVGSGSITTRGIKNYGTMVQNGGTVIACDTNGGYGVWNYGDFTMNGGTLKATHVGSYADKYGPCCLGNESGAVATLNGGYIASVNARTYAIISNGTLNVTPQEGKEVKVYAPRALSVDGGTTIINGGTFETYDSRFVDGDYTAFETYYPLYYFGGSLTVNDGKFIAPEYAIYNTTSNNESNGGKSIVISVNGGCFDAPAFIRTDGIASTENLATIIGGQFAEKVSNEYLAEDYCIYKDDASGYWTAIYNEHIIQNSFCGCGLNHKHADSDILFTRWDATDSLPTSSGNYYLASDVTLNDYCDLLATVINLDLNGKTVDLGEYSIYVDIDAVLNVVGCNGTILTNEEYTYGLENYGTLNISVGTVTGFNTAIYNEGTFVMSGDALITAFTVGVENYGTFYMEGGTIQGVDGNGNGVGSYGTEFNMSGGVIRDCEVAIDVAINVILSGNVTFINNDIDIAYDASSEYITVTSNFASNSAISLNRNQDPTTNNPTTLVTADASVNSIEIYKNSFVYTTSAEGDYLIRVSGEYLVVYKAIYLTLDANGGTFPEGTVTTLPYAVVDIISTPSVSLEKLGYSVLGWSTVVDGEVISDWSNYTLSQDTTLYAIWTLNAPVVIAQGVNATYTGQEHVASVSLSHDILESLTVTYVWYFYNGSNWQILDGAESDSLAFADVLNQKFYVEVTVTDNEGKTATTESEEFDFIISKKVIEIYWVEDDFTYTGIDQKASITAWYVDVNSAVVDLKVNFSGDFKDYSENGYVFSVSFQNNETNYALPEEASKVYYIKKANAEISVDTADILVNCGDTVVLPVATTNFGNVTCDTKASDIVEEGTYTVTFTVEDTINYNGASVSINVTVSHLFNQENALDSYKVSDATCTQKAVYYISCLCGEASTDTFEHGDLIAHVYDNSCDTTCNECDFLREITHDYSVLKHTATEHYYECNVCHTENNASREAHFGGEATCSNKAVCSVCDTAYGDYDADNHTSGTEIRDAVQATSITNGYTGDTYCLGCDALLVQGKDIPALGVAIDVPSKGEASVQVGVIVDSGNAVLDHVSKEVIEEVKSNSNEQTVFSVDLTTVKEEVTSLEIQKDSLQNFVDVAENNDVALEIAFSSGKVQLDTNTMQAVLNELKGSALKLVINKIETQKLNESQQNALKNSEVYDGVEVYMVDESDNRISNFNGGVATLTVSFEVPEGKNANDFAVWYIAEDGTKTKLNTWYEDGKLVWEVGHFSDFVIIYTNPLSVYIPVMITAISLALLIITLCIAFLVSRKLKERKAFESAYSAYYKEYYNEYSAQIKEEYNRKKYPKIRNFSNKLPKIK